MAWTVVEKQAAEPLHHAGPEGRTPMEANPRRVNPCGYQMYESDQAMYRAVPLDDEALSGEAGVHPNSRAPLPVVGCPPKDPRPWE